VKLRSRVRAEPAIYVEWPSSIERIVMIVTDGWQTNRDLCCSTGRLANPFRNLDFIFQGAKMVDLKPETSPQAYARIGGGLYLIIIVVGAPSVRHSSGTGSLYREAQEPQPPMELLWRFWRPPRKSIVRAILFPRLLGRHHFAFGFLRNA
jgi:hypothetical protein